MLNNREYKNLKVRIKTDKEVIEEAKHAMREARKEAIENGTANMTMEEIDAIIALSRKERRTRKESVYGN